MDDDDSACDSSIAGAPRASSPPTTNVSSRPSTTQVRSRITVVCAECKRLKLKCDRRTPCSSCVKREVVKRCQYTAAASDKIDVQSVHNATLSQFNLLQAFCDLFGMSEDDMNVIMNAQSYPPYEDYRLPANARRIRDYILSNGAVDGDDMEEVAPTRGPRRALPSPSGEGESSRSGAKEAPRRMVNSGAFVVFSLPPANSTRIGAGALPAPTSTSSRKQKGSRIGSTFGGASIGATMAWTAMDMASRVFQSNSTVVAAEFESGLAMWCSAMGWEARPVHVRSVDEPTGSGEKPLHIVPIVAPHSELDFHDAPAPKDLQVMAISYQMFVAPMMASLTASASAAGLKSPFPFTFASATSPAASPYQQHLSSTGPSPTPPAAPTLVTAKHILDSLPPREWRDVLWKEFESVMVVHEGVSGPGRSIWKRRIEMMFEWADQNVLDKSEGGGDTGSQASGSSHSSHRMSTTSRSRVSKSGVGSLKSRSNDPPPPPPTLALFAVACAVYSLGALNYACKTAHGFDGLDQDASAPMPPPPSSAGAFNVAFSLTGDSSAAIGMDAPPSKPNPVTSPLPGSISSHLLHCIARASIATHDQLDLPPSIDYLHAHVLTWLYLLHPSDSLSSVTSAGFDGAVKGISGGGVTVVEPTIWKDLGKCMNVARGMGLSIVDEEGPETASVPAGSFVKAEDGVADEGRMGIWEREMRRRVWWELCYYDSFISESMGHRPLIDDDTSRSTLIPTDLDESSFDPTSTLIPLPIDEGTPGQNLNHFTAKCRLLQLMRSFRRQTFRTPNSREMSIELAQAFETKINEWKDSLPAHFQILFGEDIHETHFPHSDVIAAQACDLHILANSLVLQLWWPFVKEFLPSAIPHRHQTVALACSTAANSIIVASHHLLTRFRTTRPLSFGFYGFGRPVWLAGTLLASILIAMPHIMFASTARRGLNTAILITQDQVLCGKTEGAAAKPKYEVTQLLVHLKMMSERVNVPKGGGAPSLGSKRKAEDHTQIVPMRHGFQIPYTGQAVISAAGDIELVYGPGQSFRRTIPPASASASDPPPPRSVVASPAPMVSLPPPPRPRAKTSTSVVSGAWDDAASEHVVGGANGEYVTPSAGAFQPLSHRPSGSVLSASSSNNGPIKPMPHRSRPAIGIRDRSKMSKQGPASSQGSTTDAQSKSKRARKSVNEAGSTVSSVMDASLSAVGRHTSASYQPPPPVVEAAPLMNGTMPPPIQQTAAPRPTVYDAPPYHQARSSMSDIGPNPHSRPPSAAARYQQQHQASPYRGSGSDLGLPPPREYQPSPPFNQQQQQQPQRQDYRMVVDDSGSGSMYQGGYRPGVAASYGEPQPGSATFDGSPAYFNTVAYDTHGGSSATSSTVSGVPPYNPSHHADFGVVPPALNTSGGAFPPYPSPTAFTTYTGEPGAPQPQRQWSDNSLPPAHEGEGPIWENPTDANLGSFNNGADYNYA